MLSIVGSFTNIRGGDAYADIVRKSEKKPLRVFLQDGRNDNRGVRNGVYDQRRDWFFQNVRLMQALTEKGYDVNYTWGIGRHGSEAGRRDLPGHDALAVARSSGVDGRERRDRAIVPGAADRSASQPYAGAALRTASVR